MRNLFAVFLVAVSGIAQVGIAQADVGVITFDNLTPEQLGPVYCCHEYHKLGYSLDIDGFNFHNIGAPGGGSEFGIQVWAEGSLANSDPNGYTFAHRYPQSVTKMTKLDGNPFSVVSIDVGNYDDQYASDASVTFSADLLGGTTISKTITTDEFLGLETIELNWWGVTAFYFRNDSSQLIQVDNIALAPQSPEPAPVPLPLPNQITMDFENLVIEICNPCEVYGFSFKNGFFGGITPGTVGSGSVGTGESFYALPIRERHFLMTQKNGLEFGLESIDLAFIADDYYYYLSDEWILRGYDVNGRGIAELRVKRPTNQNQWVTVALDPIWHSGLSKIEIFGQKTLEGDFAFIDNLIVNVPAIEVDFDVQPWFTSNELDPVSTNKMPVGIYTTSIADGDAVDFDALLIDPATVKFGFGEAPVFGVTTELDLDGDLDDDLLLGFAIQDAGIICEDTELTVTGSTTDGTEFFGVDSITTTNCETSSCHP